MEECKEREQEMIGSRDCRNNEKDASFGVAGVCVGRKSITESDGI